ncbi:glycosyltransferase [Pseudomonas rhizosphaerae]|uniref:glycosyltransferase n=1 Tax=Pseudomonas rhizosphaerae TaxID=216142 RepID=UPI002B466AFB|nr:glycosyltransferase [Pseudomonas rhizosphaerae]MEB2870401.1 glycosyltransferase [Pseudomonas rhizosphaerae]
MSHFGVVAPAFYSHFHALQALAQELMQRGHRVTFFHQADAARWVTAPGIGYCVLGAASHPPGSLQRSLRLAASPGTPWGLRQIIEQLAATTRMFCNELPAALEQHGVDALLCDQMEAGGGLVAESLGLPFVSIACALPVNREPGLPLPVMPFAYGTDERSLHMYRGSTQVYDWLMKPHVRAIQDAAEALGLTPRSSLHECLSPLAQISQTLAGFDFPRQAAPAHLHAVGPLRNASTTAQGSWPIDPHRPFIFASLGTLQGQRLGMFEQIAKACRQLDAQLLIAHCGLLDAAAEKRLCALGATWVTDFAPQRWALEHADAVVTHGGLNTVMDAIASATPMLVMPIAFDQPGVAARVRHHGLGLQVQRRARASRIAQTLREVLALSTQPFARLSGELSSAGGTLKAADIVETAINTRQPVLAGALA